MSDEDYEPTQVEYINDDWPFKFTFFSEWAHDLWSRLLGRTATDFEAAIENERYRRKPRDLA